MFQSRLLTKKTRYLFGYLLCLVTGLFAAACGNLLSQPPSTAVSQISATATVHKPETIPVSATTTETSNPTDTPVATPTPAPLPTETPRPLPAIFQEPRPLGINWGLSAFFPGFIEANDPGEFPALIHGSFHPDRELSIVDAMTGQTMVELPFEADKHYKYDSSANSLYIVTSAEDNPVVHIENRVLRDGSRLWETTLTFPRSPSHIIALPEGLLLINHQYESGPNNSFTFLSSSDGQLLWELKLGTGCFIAGRQIHIVDDHLHIICDEEIWFVSIQSGEITATLDIELGRVFNVIITDQTVFMIRGIQEDAEIDGRIYEVENSYLEARDSSSYNLLWSRQVPAELHYLETLDGDVIYRIGNQVLRLNGENGEPRWQTTLAGDLPSILLVSGQWLSVGSSVGYIHLLDSTDGRILWEQDIWATIEPRSPYVVPVALLNEAIILQVGNNVLSIGRSENMVWERPTPPLSPTPTSTPMATPIPTPVIPSDGSLPDAPAAYELWPATVIAFLNVHPTNLDRLPDLLAEWSDSISIQIPSFNSSFELEAVDLNENGRQELIILIDGPYIDFASGWAMVIQQDQAGQFSLAWEQPATMPSLLTLLDLNNNGTVDFVFGNTSFGFSQSFVRLVPVGWDGQAFVDLSYEPIASTNVHLDEVKIEDVTGDGRLEIIIRGGTFGSNAAGPNRTSTFTYSWSDDGYILLSQEPDLPQDYYFFLVDANRHLVAGDLDTAVAIYENSFDSADAFNDTPHQRAFAEFQLMLAYLLLGDEESAALWANSGNYPDQLYSQVKRTFWDLYQENRDWTTAAEAARKQVRLAGYDKVQLVPFVGYANIPLSLEDILPCAECLQGSIGSPLGP